MACARCRSARAARSPPDRACGPSRRAIAAVGAGSLLRPMAPERAHAQATVGGTVPGPHIAASGRRPAGQYQGRHARDPPGSQPSPRSVPGREGAPRAAGEHPRLVANRRTGATLRTCRLTRPRRPNFAHRFQSGSTRRRNTMQVSEAMTNDVRIASPNQTIRDAARLMAQIDAGVLPVGENDRLVGMITDRDIAIRAIGADKGPQTPIREIMSKEVMYCFDDDELDDIVQNMADIKVRRLPVLDHNKRLVGILSLGDIALTDGAGSAGSALCGISEPGGEHSQSMDGARGMRGT